MSHMKIGKKNEVYLQIETEPHIARELSEYFTFEVPGAKFMPAYRNKVWDGKIRLYSIATGQIYLGLLPYIREFCKRNDIQYELLYNNKHGNIDEEHINSFIQQLNLPHKARDYQISSILYCARKCRGLLISPTAYFKSLFNLHSASEYDKTKLSIFKLDKVFLSINSFVETILLAVPNKPSNTSLCVCVSSNVPVKPKRYLQLIILVMILVKDFDLNK